MECVHINLGKETLNLPNMLVFLRLGVSLLHTITSTFHNVWSARMCSYTFRERERENVYCWGHSHTSPIRAKYYE